MYTVIKVCSNGGAAYINSKLIGKVNVNIAVVMQTFENLILQNCSTGFMIFHTHGPWVCVIKVCSSGYNNVKLYNITIIVHYNV